MDIGTGVHKHLGSFGVSGVRSVVEWSFAVLLLPGCGGGGEGPGCISRKLERDAPPPKPLKIYQKIGLG